MTVVAKLPDFAKQLPSEWKVLPVRLLGRITNGATPSSGEPAFWDGEIVWITPEDLGRAEQKYIDDSARKLTSKGYAACGTTTVPINSIIISIRAPIGHLAITKSEACLNQGCRAITLNAGHSARYFYYQLLAAKQDLASLGTGSTFMELSREKLAAFKLLVPPTETQRAIADFLDRETKKIDDLITKQSELVKAAIQKQTSEVEILLTTGANNGALVSSPVPWIGNAPSHWQFIRAKFLFKERSDPPLESDGVVTAFRDGQVTLRSNRRSEGFTFAELEVGYQRVLQGDLVIHTMDAFAGAIGVSESDGKCTGEYAVCIPKDGRVNNEYYASLLRLMARRGYIFVLCPSVRERAPRYRFVRFADTLLPLPPRSEQDSIVASLTEIRREYGALIERCEAQVRLLREHRAAIITAAVTGQIEVCGAASGRHAAVIANDNCQAYRTVVGAEIISRHGTAKIFGRVKLQKLLYLAEVHAGVHELGGTYTREAAGPLARELLSDAERGMAAAGYYNTVVPVGEGDGYTYTRIGKAGAHRDQLMALLGQRATALDSLIDLLKDYDTRQVEAITTLYAVWNDALLDGETPADDRIIHGVLAEWHPEKPEKFTVADLKTWLGWMRRNGLVPRGTGARTQIDRLFV